VAAIVGWVSAARRRPWVLTALVVVAAGFSGASGAARERSLADTPLPAGPISVLGRVLSDPEPVEGGIRLAVGPSHLKVAGRWLVWQGPPLGVYCGQAAVAVGDRVLVEGSAHAEALRFSGGTVAGSVRAHTVTLVDAASDPLFAAGNALRRRVITGVGRFGDRPAAALLDGFLIGDDGALPESDAEALRLAGLSHFVAVSGSNVALFLGAWWLAAGPLAWGPRRRAAVGLLGLAVFLVVTRWEPSVLRAGVMAAMVLCGRLAGVAVNGWVALGGTVTLLTLLSGGLADDVGFQLSAAATAGVLAGAGAWPERRPRWVWTALGATVAAQAAVAPLLLIHFGSVPLFAPVTNVVAAPLVAFATAAGGIGVLAGLPPVTGVGLVAAEAVLAIARSARDLPQLGWFGVGIAGSWIALAGIRRLRPALALVGMVAVAAMVVIPPGRPSTPEAAFLDVGQGDSILLRGPSGEVVLVDGGPDPSALRRALVARGIRRVDLLVVTHSHADHLAGLAGITSWVKVDRAWHVEQDGEVQASLLAELAASGTSLAAPGPGWTAQVGAFGIEVLGPRRRFASPNDGSMVLRVSAGGKTLLLPGDIEALAQGELGPLTADIMKVPHQGAATSDPAWLAASAPRVAVICVGANEFGHPAAETMSALASAGAQVRRTDLEGDVVIGMGDS
jgi:competence protein ComEC